MAHHPVHLNPWSSPEAEVSERLLHRIGAELEQASLRENGPVPLAASLYPGQESKEWLEGAHLDLLNERLKQLINREITRLIIMMPPRHGKSTVCSIYLPINFLSLYPQKHVILAGHTASLVRKFSRTARNLVRDHPELGLRLASDSSAQMDWALETGGGLVSSGVGGPITGRGGDLLILDDPYKNDEDARSVLYNEMLWDWWRSTLLTRAEPEARLLLIMTRWYDEDLCGRLLKEQGDRWTVLRLKAISDGESDALHRPAGEALWPARYPIDALLDKRRELGERLFESQYQQEPYRKGGHIFKRSDFRYFEVHGHRDDDERVYELQLSDGGRVRYRASECSIFQTCDPAGTTKEHSDYFALLTWAVSPARQLLLLDVMKERAETVKHLPILRQSEMRWKPDAQYIEEEKFGLAVMQQAKQEGRPLLPLKPNRDKVARSWALESLYQNGLVFHRRDGRGIEAYEAELEAFPSPSVHDDCADCGFYAGLVITERFKKSRAIQGSVLTSREGGSA